MVYLCKKKEKKSVSMCQEVIDKVDKILYHKFYCPNNKAITHRNTNQNNKHQSQLQQFMQVNQASNNVD